MRYHIFYESNWNVRAFNWFILYCILCFKFFVAPLLLSSLSPRWQYRIYQDIFFLLPTKKKKKSVFTFYCFIVTHSRKRNTGSLILFVENRLVLSEDFLNEKITNGR